LSSSSPQPPFELHPEPLSHPKRVLIVDDNNFLRQTLTEVFRQTLTEVFRREPNFDVCGEACNGHEAIRAAQLLHPDLIVLDLAMPVLNGLDAARMLKRLMPGTPLIMYSGIGDRYVEHQAKLMGIAALVAKAEPPTSLVDCARRVLDRKPCN
jgi:DNA-binding NarL/FixJ family response regulator